MRAIPTSENCLFKGSLLVVLVFTVSACWTFFVCLLLFLTSSRISDACIMAWIPLLNARSTKIQKKWQTNDECDCFLCQLRLGLSFTLTTFATGVSPTSSLVYATVRSSTQFFPLCNLFKEFFFSGVFGIYSLVKVYIWMRNVRAINYLPVKCQRVLKAMQV